jgi:chemotaxis protein methyltransferase CheR
MMPHENMGCSEKAMISFTDQDFARVSKYATVKFGISLDPAKRNLLYSRIARRMRLVDMRNFDQYFSLVETGKDDREVKCFISILTTNVTSFFRERHHFDLMRKMLRSNLTRSTGKRVIRIWSAGCSTGQEAYSISSIMYELTSSLPDVEYEILASDVDDIVLDKARTGKFSRGEISGLGSDDINRIFENCGKDSFGLTIRKSLRDRVSFRNLNLVSLDEQPSGMDYIFCRNVVIYFNRETQVRLWGEFHRRLNDGGFLLLGQAERLSGGFEKSFKSVGQTAFQKQRN